MSNTSDFVIKNGVLIKYCGSDVDVIIPEGVDTIADQAFYKCENLTSVTIQEGTRKIAGNAFFACQNLKSVTIPKSMHVIDSYAFLYCCDLKTITILGASIEHTRPFGWCLVDYDANVTAVIVGTLEPSTAEVLSKTKGIKRIFAPNTAISEIAGKQKAALAYWDHPDSYAKDVVEGYRKYIARQGMWMLPDIFEQDRVDLLECFADYKKINAENIDQTFLSPAMAAAAHQCVAFLLNWKGTHVPIEQQEKMLERELTKDPYNVADMKRLWNYKKMPDGTLCLTKYKGTDTNVVIPERIGNDMVSDLADLFCPKTGMGGKKADADFLNTISSVTIPPTITELYAGTFRGCKGLADQDGFIIVRNILFDYIGTARKIKIPEGVTAIDGTFSTFPKSNYRLQQVEIPASVEEICYGAFKDCEKLKSVILHKGLRYIGGWAFSRCESLTNIVLPDSVTQIDDDAFYGCTSLTIHAPAGSYAEQYAKENNIPFVAE